MQTALAWCHDHPVQPRGTACYSPLNTHRKTKMLPQVDELLQSGTSLYRAGPEVGQAIDALIAENPTAEPGPATLRMGQGTWEVTPRL